MTLCMVKDNKLNYFDYTVGIIANIMLFNNKFKIQCLFYLKE